MTTMTRADIEAIIDARLAARSAGVEATGTVASLKPLQVTLRGGGAAYVTLTDPSLVLAVGNKVALAWVGTGYMITGLAGAPIAPTATQEPTEYPPAPHNHTQSQITDFGGPYSLASHTHPMPAEQQASDDTVQTKSTAGVWASGSPGQDITFTAPPSGRVVITTSARARAASNNILTVSFVLHEGTGSGGTQIVGESALRGQNIWVASAAGTLTNPYLGGSDKSWMVSGLTPGDTYYTQLRYDLAVAGTVEIRARVIRVTPTN